MTAGSARVLSEVLQVMGDATPAEVQYQVLLSALRKTFGCEACALLRLQGDVLIPVAVSGLSPDTLGRRFLVKAHPRLQAFLERPEPTHFGPECQLPDPYDGLVEGGAVLEVHDCLGCPLFVRGQLWGVLTLDALEPGRFARLGAEDLQLWIKLTCALLQATQYRVPTVEAAGWLRWYAHSEDASPLIGESPVFQQLQHEIEVVGPSDLTVLIQGETGVGKERVAEALHKASARAAQPLVCVNCAALPEHLVESELFGHVRGAFSGAHQDRGGKFDQANQGTLLLDEVGELPLGVQAKLLRVLQGGQIQRLGSDREHRVDTRILAATNRDLLAEVQAGRFRADLYHRLSVYPLRVPALRERGRDILLLAGYFLELGRVHLGLRALRLATEAQRLLLQHTWPGNVRELEHLISRATVKALAAHPQKPRILSIPESCLDLAVTAPSTLVEPVPLSTEVGLQAAVQDLQARLIMQRLQQYAGNWSQAARSLDMDRANLARLARRLGLKL